MQLVRDLLSSSQTISFPLFLSCLIEEVMESSWVGRGSQQGSAQHTPLLSQCLLGESSWTPGPAEALINGNAEHMLTKPLVQVRGQTATQASSTHLIRLA